ncbi:unnamed protein product, partial [Amoebophrya sp. A25]
VLVSTLVAGTSVAGGEQTAQPAVNATNPPPHPQPILPASAIGSRAPADVVLS